MIESTDPQGQGRPVLPGERSPVFVDASGSRRRGLRLAGAIVAVPPLAYLCVLVSAVLGGPTISAPFLPLPALPVVSAALVIPHAPLAGGSTSVRTSSQPAPHWTIKNFR